MLKKLLVLAIIATAFVSCKKIDNNACPYTASTAVAPANEIASLQAYINANHPGAVQHSSGFFYEITNPGTGATPSVCSYITVKYTGTLTSGAQFDSSSPAYPSGLTLALGGLIAGWQKGIPLIKSGGSINLYLPPSLGYGSQDQRDQTTGAIIIPGNSITIFTIQLVAVQ
jgi:FKBP-type peptidyl-prolyl cis-trans isomerase FkpA